MTNKIYKTAKGKSIDVGSLRLQNEQVRAVGNMGVNARGDRIDAMGQVIDSANQQLQRRVQKQTNVVSNTPVHTSTRARDAEIKAQQEAEAAAAAEAKFQADRRAALEDEPDGPMDEPVVVVQEEEVAVVAAPVVEEVIEYIQPQPQPEVEPVVEAKVEALAAKVEIPKPAPIPTSGLAAAIARAKTVKQELEKSPKQLAQEQGVKKI